MPAFNQLTPGEAERLALLAEELGESIQAIGKILRHGYESRHPDGGPTNRQSLEIELGDVKHAINRICESGDLSASNIEDRTLNKAVTVQKYLHHQ